ncbi:uncharacterized protein [Lolium perenne]|uniref:uncharacterized protein isoform X2 n=1 Tax=Lolium perenne TaxID=4522 RepID=UPI003A9913C5
MAAAPFVYLRPSDDGTGQGALMRAAFDGNLGRLKGVVKSLLKENGDPGMILSFITDGLSVLHVAAIQGHLEICKYLVEDLGGDANAPGAVAGAGVGDCIAGATPFMISAHSGDVPTVRYFLDQGGDLLKADVKGCTVLHHAAGAGSCKVTEFLLSKGVPVDIDYGQGTPLYVAATNEKDKTLKILLDHHANPNVIVHGMQYPLMAALIYRSLKCMKLLIKAGADVNGKGSIMTPLVFATGFGGYTNFIQLLLKAGADPNIPDDLGILPIEHAAVRDCKEEVEMLFPLTYPIPNVRNWSIEGVISHAKIEAKKPLVIDHGENATLFANRSICKLAMGDGEGALSDALRCRMLRPKWAKACYRQGAAHMLLKEYKQACDALRDAQKLDPGNAEVERELSKAMELMKAS